MKWSQGYQDYQEYQGYEGYQDYQEYKGYQGNNFRSLNQQRRFQQEMTSNIYQWSNERGMPKKSSATHDVDHITILTAKVDSLLKMLEQTQFMTDNWLKSYGLLK